MLPYKSGKIANILMELLLEGSFDLPNISRLRRKYK